MDTANKAKVSASQATRIRNLVRSDVGQSALAFAVRLATGVVSYILFALVARVAGPNEFGIFSVMFSAAMMIGTAGSFGQQVFLVKEVPQATANNRPDEAAGALAFSLVVTLFFSVAGAALYLVASPLITGIYSPLALCAGAALSLLYALSQTTMGILRIKEKTLLAMATRDLAWRLFAVVGIGVLALFASSRAVEAYEPLAIVAGCLVPVLALHAVILVSDLWRKLRSSVKTVKWRRWFETSAGLAVVAVISSADLYIYTISLGSLMPASETGAFFAALKTVELLNLFLMAVTLIISPEISRLIAARDPVALQRKCNAAIILQGTPAIMCSLLMIVAAPVFMWFFDPSYIAASDLLRLLVIGMLINALTGATVLMLQLSGLHWLQVALQGGSLALSVLALPYLVGNFGVYGAAVAFILSKILWNVLAIIVIRRKLNVDPSIVGLLDRRTGGLRGLRAGLADQLKLRSR